MEKDKDSINGKNNPDMATADYKSIAKKLKFEGRAYINGKYEDAEALNQYLQTKTIWISHS